MPQEDYIKIKVGDYEVQATKPDDIPVSISYALEDEKNFQSKKSSQGFDISTPAINENASAANSFHNPSVEDLTEGTIFKKYQPAVIEAASFELLVGKAILKNAIHTDVPISYTWNFYGDNSDWLIDSKDTTLYDVLKHISFAFTKQNIEGSWLFDGRNEALPYVFAPVKYRPPFGGYKKVDNKLQPVNNLISTEYMRPSISKYWILHWGFKLLGYKIESNFLDTDYYRRMVMPWTWGNFLDSEGTRLEAHRFLAKSGERRIFVQLGNGSNTAIIDVEASNDSSDGGYDANNEYSYNTSTFEMTWQYLPPHFGKLTAAFSMTIDVSCAISNNSRMEMRVQWEVNGVLVDSGWGNYQPNGNEVFTSDNSFNEIYEIFSTIDVNPNDIVTAKIYVYSFKSFFGAAGMSLKILQFKLEYFKIPLGGTIDFSNYSAFKKYKFLDFLAGECDLYDLSFNTDSVAKKVYIEPTHAYSTNNDLSQTKDGYFVNDAMDWENKKDFSKQWEIGLYSDGERQQLFQFKNDTNDGVLKKVQDRNTNVLGLGKYVLPERFTDGKKSNENRFFAATMHYEVDEFKNLGTGPNVDVSPQMICIIPENISNTSQSESANTFMPKSAWYKGLINGVGAWNWDGTVRQDYPFMFAVNYKPGGEHDPIISYSDEKIKTPSGFVVGKGLVKRFYWQRMAIQRNGQRYISAFLKLKNYDVANQLHREFKILQGQKWELIQINGYRPLSDDSTKCLLYKWVPVIAQDNENTYPSDASVLNGTISDKSADLKYAPLKCLITDIPTT